MFTVDLFNFGFKSLDTHYCVILICSAKVSLIIKASYAAPLLEQGKSNLKDKETSVLSRVYKTRPGPSLGF